MATLSTPGLHLPSNSPQPPSGSSYASASSRISSGSNNTYVMSGSPVKSSRKRSQDNYTPKIITTVGQKPACLVNASVTYVGNDQIYAFGGFDQYTDEVYNHVLKLNLVARQWSLVDNYGDIPGVRMGHTANLWEGDKLLVYGGENEHRAYLSDVIIFDLKTAHWTQPELNGPAPRGRARHSAVIHDNKLFVLGGMTGHDSYVLDDVCYLDLKTWTWSRTWRFVPRYDHSSWVWGGKIWVFGGLGEDMERTSEVWWLDFRNSPAFEAGSTYGPEDRAYSSSRYQNYSSSQTVQPTTGSTGYAANSSSVQVNPPSHMINRNPPIAPGSISSLKFISSPDLPTQALGTHFHVFSSGCLLDFVTPASVISSFETSLSALDLDTLRWSKLADGKDLFNPSYRWHYCAMNEDGTQAWLLGCPTEPPANGGNPNSEEYLSDVLPIDLRKLGLLGNSLTLESHSEQAKMPASDTHATSHLTAIGADLARTFDQPPASGSSADFIITGERDDEMDLSDDEHSSTTPSASSDLQQQQQPANASRPIHVHKLILQARWPHFSRLYSAQMSEFHTKRMHIPEPYAAVRAFLYYLYTDSIASNPNSTTGGTTGPSLEDVAGMLVMSNIYDMPRLKILCVNRLGKELDVEHAACVWERAGTAGEEWLKRRAAAFCMTHWGRVVRTQGFRNLRRRAFLELCEEIDRDGRVVGGDELEAVGGLGGGRFGVGGVGGGQGREGRKRGVRDLSGGVGEDEAEAEGDEDEGMEIG
ncbi:hypothetical protein LTR04_001533 [Oleoguttula sp. CCFEE 6159]|nr:hypothetical protein LTR04_001533 [Oleoguttula sp. CCFEE 6159]